MFMKIILSERLVIQSLWFVGLSYSSFPAMGGVWHLGHHTVLGGEPVVKGHQSQQVYVSPLPPARWLQACH